VILPVCGISAIRNVDSEDLDVFIWVYTLHTSFMNLPAGVVPVTQVSEDEQRFLDEVYRDMYSRKMHEVMRGSGRFPVGVHVLTLPYR